MSLDYLLGAIVGYCVGTILTLLLIYFGWTLADLER